jgi:hypothetical protein
MLDPQRELLALVDNFVADLSALAKRFALEQIKAAFGVGVKVASPPRLASSPSSSSSGPERASRARRGQREIEALRGKLLAAIAERPGRRAEDINTTLGTKTPQIAQLLRRLVADQLVRTEGARRGTRYFATAPGDMQSGRRAGSESSASVEEPAR